MNGPDEVLISRCVERIIIPNTRNTIENGILSMETEVSMHKKKSDIHPLR
jgi:hypothetical protein